jgi:putative ABC transport system permease protein
MPDLPREACDLTRPTRRDKADRRFAWWLVWLYPPRFRRDVGLALADAVEDRIRERRGRGAGTIAAWTPALADTFRNAALEWVHPGSAISAMPSARVDSTAPSHATSPSYGTHQRRSMFDLLRQDVRYALRLWRRRPGFALIAIATLALGVGANTAMFSIVNAVLLRPLPYPHADRLVSVWAGTQAFPRGLLTYTEYEELRRQRGSVESVGLWFPQSVNLTGVPEPQRLVGVFVSGSFFDILGLRAERGRLFTEEETAPGTVQPVVVITHAFWRERFNSDPSAIGSTLTLNGTPLTIIGVMAAPFDPETVPRDGYFISGDLFLPAAQFPAPDGLRAAGPVMLGVGRVKPGVSTASANADLGVISKRLADADPKAQGSRTMFVELAQDSVVGDARSALVLLFGAVGIVLLIACVNVSHLLLARATDREKELALRAALGASRTQVTRQLAVEAMLMAVVSSAAGLLLGRWSLQAVPAWRSRSVPIPAQIPLDANVLLFTGAVALGTAILCALAPALRTSRPDLNRVLQTGSRRVAGSGGRTRDLLMIVEMAMSVALVAVSVLLVQSLFAMQQAPLGFDPSNVFSLQFRLPPTKYQTPEEIARFFRAAIERVRAVPGVESAALVRAVPFSGNGGTVAFAIEGRPAPEPASAPQARFHLVTPDYFRTLRIPLLKGRDFSDRDDLQAPLVAVVNETFARRAWPDEDPIGKRFTTPQTNAPITVIGVVGDTKHYTATEAPMPQLYAAHYQVPLIFCSLVARTRVPAMSVANDVRRAIWAVDRDQPVWAIQSLQQQVDATQGQSQFLAVLLVAFAGVALILAGVGIYGVTSYGVSQRTHEIGIRLALGASAERVLGEVVGRGLKVIGAAVVVGVVLAIVAGRLAGSLLFGVEPTDPLALAGAAAVLGVVAMAATYIPARRAASVDPVIALAEE